MTALDAFRELARRYSLARRRYDNMAKCGRRDDVDEALSAVQEIEQEFLACFRFVRAPAGEGRAGV